MQRISRALFYFVPVVAGGILVTLMTTNSACQGSKVLSAAAEPPAAESRGVPPIDAAQPERVEAAVFAFG
jgi:hypothetical protein